MRHVVVILFATLLTLCVAVVGMGAQVSSAPTFVSKVLSANRSSVQIDTSGLTAAAGSMFLMCNTAALTIEGNFKYFRMENHRTESRGKGSFEVEFFQSPPEGAEVVQLDSLNPAKPTGDPEKWVFDAVAASAACKKLGVGRDGAK